MVQTGITNGATITDNGQVSLDFATYVPLGINLFRILCKDNLLKVLTKEFTVCALKPKATAGDILLTSDVTKEATDYFDGIAFLCELSGC